MPRRRNKRAYDLYGVRKVEKNIELALGAKVEAAGLANVTEGRIVLGRAQQLVPVNTGALLASGDIDEKLPGPPAPGRARRTGRFIAGIPGVRITFGSREVNYAVPVHERTDVHHPIGQAKYLETALKERMRNVGRSIAAAAARARPARTSAILGRA